MSGRPSAGATFEVRRIERGRSRAPIGILVVVGLFAVLVGVGVTGHVAVSPTTADRSAATPAPTVNAAALVPAPGDHVFLADPIDLVTPALGPITLTSPKLAVAGRLLVPADHVEIALEARNNRVLDRVTVDTSGIPADFRPTVRADFRADFVVPYPRPNGTMWIVVTAYDRTGIPLGGERRPFVVGPIAEADMTPVFGAVLEAALGGILGRGGASRLMPM
jgi:hypothetical protein